MYNKFKILLILFIVFFSCDNREWDNPFDSDCPKEIYTPINFKAIQQDNTVILLWEQTNTKITNYKIEKQIDNSESFLLVELDKSISSFNDSELQGGQPHKYTLYSIAGTNESNKVYATITPVLPPTVITSPVSTYSTNAAVLGGTVVSDGGATVTERGICYSKTPSPTVNHNKIVIESGIGEFGHKTEELDSITTYHIRAYAVNSKGISYGDEVSFTTDEPLTDVEGNVYKTVIIGNQVWMAENMTHLPEVSPPSVESYNEPHYYIYGYTGTNISEAKATVNYNTFGVLYNWQAAMQICPDGWHLPTDSEWEKLAEYVSQQKGPYSKLGDNWRGVGKHLKSTGTINDGNGLWLNSNEGDVGTDDFSFTGLPGGCRDGDGIFKYKNQYGYWWSANESSATGGFYRSLSYYHTYFAKASPAKDLGLSVRCIKD